MAVLVDKQFDGVRSAIIVVRVDASTANTVVAQANLMSPPCRTFTVRKITYDVGIGNTCTVFFGTVAPVPVTILSNGNGQTMDFEDWAGVHNTNPAVNGVLSISASVTGTDGVALMIEITKRY